MSYTIQEKIGLTKNFLIAYLSAKHIQHIIEARNESFYEIYTANGLCGYFGIDKDQTLRYVVINNGLRNWARQEGITSEMPEYLNLALLIELKNEISLARFMAGERNYEVKPK